MKKTRNLLLAGILLLGVASCGDSKSSSSSSGGIAIENKTILTVDNVTTVIGQTSTKTITITNPFNEEATMDIYGTTQSSIYGSPISITNTTCGTLLNGILYANGIKMQANQSCEITLTHTPTTLETIQYSFTAEFKQSPGVICPTPTTVPTLEQVINAQIFLDYEINYYAQNSNNVKSPAYINIHFGKVTVSNGQATADIPAKPFTIELTEGDVYTINNYMNSWTFTADNTNCSIDGITITALKTGSCNLNVGYTYKAGENNNIYSTTYPISPDGDKTLKPTYNLSLGYYDEGYGTLWPIDYVNQMLQQYCQQTQGQQKVKILEKYFK